MTVIAEFESKPLRLNVYTSDDRCTGTVGKASVEPDGTYMFMDETVRVTAQESKKHEFLGWYPVIAVSNGLVKGYDADNRLSGELGYSFRMTGEISIVAVFKENSDRDRPSTPVYVIPLTGIE